MMTFTPSDWRAGLEPHNGWSEEAAKAAGWTEEELDAWTGEVGNNFPYVRRYLKSTPMPAPGANGAAPAGAVGQAPGKVAPRRRKPAPSPAGDVAGVATPHGDPADEARPAVRLSHLHVTTDAAERALIIAGTPIFVHAERLQRPVVDEVAASGGRRTKVARFKDITPTHMRDLMSRAMQFEKWDGRSSDYKKCDPPHDVAVALLDRAGEWLFPAAAGVITTPTLRPDGSILATEGYDAETRLVLMAPPAMPPIPETPTRDDAAAALDLLGSLLDEFSFADGASWSVALSGLITPVVRGGMTVAPLHVNRAPVAGSGKSYLVDVASCISTGQICPVITPGRTEEETEKRLGGMLLSGQPIVSLDNVNGELSGDFLCQVIERPLVRVRPLGRSDTVLVENKGVIFATGNNLTVAGDLVRRSIVCSLDTMEERPELREFSRKPVELVLADRGRFVAAALTIVRAYVAAGCPDQRRPLASFEDWSRLVRSALCWLDCADPVATMDMARAEDPELGSLRRVFAELHAAFPAPATAGTIIEMALERVRDAQNNPGALKNPGMNEAMTEIAYVKGTGLSSRKLAGWLKRFRGRIADGLRLEGKDTRLNQIEWFMRNLADAQKEPCETLQNEDW